MPSEGRKSVNSNATFVSMESMKLQGEMGGTPKISSRSNLKSTPISTPKSSAKKPQFKEVKKEPKEPFTELPTVVTKRIIVPFEFRFTSQEVTLEIRDSSDNSILYEVQIPFEQLLAEP